VVDIEAILGRWRAAHAATTHGEGDTETDRSTAAGTATGELDAGRAPRRRRWFGFRRRATP
jgi:hypothetical protein